MSKSIERICPGCEKLKLFRADQKTCGCGVKKVVKLKELSTSDREAFLKSEVSRLNQELSKVSLFKGYQDVLNEDLLEAVVAIEPLPAVSYKSGTSADAAMAAVLKLSDWHIGAVTKAEETEGFGQFNWALAQERVQYIVQKFLGWIESHRKSFKIPVLYILSEGDMVSGNIHYELEVTNEFPVPVQAVNAGNLLAQAVATLAPHFSEVHVVEIDIDNHSRLTRKLQFAQGGENSWGHIVHGIANARLEKHGNVHIIQCPGIRQLVNINGIKFLVEHGHEVKAWMGIPFYGIERMRGKEAAKRIQAMLEQERKEDFNKYQKDIGFDYISQGHWHVPGIVSGNILINGCLPGTTEYDHAYGRYARPSQVSFLVHPKYKIFDWTPWQPKR